MDRGLGDRAPGSFFLWILQRRGTEDLVGDGEALSRGQRWVSSDSQVKGRSGLALDYGLDLHVKREGRAFQGEAG